MRTQTRLLDVLELQKAIGQFSKDRDWDQFHSPKNLVMALTGEIGELNEIFQWMTESDSWNVASSPETDVHVQDEIADVFIYLVRLAAVLKVDLNEAVTKKLEKNAKKYPADMVRGSSKKAR